MPGKFNSIDYEPLSRPQRAQTPKVDGFSASKADTNMAESESVFGGIGKRRDAPGDKTQTTPPANNSNSIAAKAHNQQEHWILKHGHTVSFVGLFLFTFIVYFRPYEWSPSFAWLSKSAYWVAVFTLAVFVPTQLGLENRLTARPRHRSYAAPTRARSECSPVNAKSGRDLALPTPAVNAKILRGPGRRRIVLAS